MSARSAWLRWWRFPAALMLAVTVAGCATLPDDFERTPSYAIADNSGTVLGDWVARAAADRAGKSGVLLLEDGLDAFVARLALSQAAERSIDAQYYLYHDDLTGRLLTHHLLAAADRGVRVRLLVDDMDLKDRETAAAALASHPKIEVRLFNPFARGSPRALQLATRFGRITRRMHNKSFTVDNAVAVVGGRNIGDEYFNASAETNFTDLDALAAGQVVDEISAAFDSYWNSALSYPAEAFIDSLPDAEELRERRENLARFAEQAPTSSYRAALENSELARRIRERRLELEWTDVSLVHDRPEKITASRDSTEYKLASELRPLFENASSELVIISPYFVPGKAGTAFLTDMASRGVRVRVLTNSLASTDVPVVHAGYVRYRRALLSAGVELYETIPEPNEGQSINYVVGGSSAASLHAKSFVFDGREVFVGSLNLDPRSIHENTEIGLVLHSETIAADLLDWFETFTTTRSWRLELRPGNSGSEKIHWLAAGEAREWTREPESGLVKRAIVSLLRWLPIESQL